MTNQNNTGSRRDSPRMGMNSGNTGSREPAGMENDPSNPANNGEKASDAGRKGDKESQGGRDTQ